MTGIIVKALSGFYYVSCENEIYECKARGNFRKNGVSPLVGDSVDFEKTDIKTGIIDKVLPRKNCMIRPPVANIDKLFIVSSYSSPRPNTFLIDKMTVIAKYNGIEPVIVFNKCDMGDFNEYKVIYEKAGFKTFVVSAEDGIGISLLQDEMKSCVSAFTGNSGVGKSSILNCIFGENKIATGEISDKLGRGRHTTRHCEIYPLQNGGYIADTPGFSSLELDYSDFELKDKLQFFFEDFEDYLGDCKFSSCTHTKESGCAVIEAVNNGDICKSRHLSYLQLFDEVKDLKPWDIKKKK